MRGYTKEKRELNFVGRVIKTLRIYYKIPSRNLCDGICSPSVLSKIEAGEQIPDRFVFERFMQRIGKSSDRIEYILSEREYILYEMRSEMEIAILEGNIAEAENLLLKYKKHKGAKLVLYQQYLLKIESVIAEEKGEYLKSIQFLKSAIALTVPQFGKDKLEKIMLGREELVLILMLVEKQGKEDPKTAEDLLYEMLRYIDNKYSDEEEYAYPNLNKKLCLWMEHPHGEIFLLHELLFNGRKKKNLSQEQLACILGIDQKTVSRIETGICVPNKSTLYKVQEKLLNERESYNGFLSVTDFELLEQGCEIGKLLSLHRDCEAEKLFDKLKLRLDMEAGLNQQYVLYTDTLLKISRKELTQKEAAEIYLKAIKITRPDIENQDYEIGLLTRNETFIICNMANALYFDGEKEKAVCIYESLLKGYEYSRVDICFHSAEVLLLLNNLSTFYEETDRFEEALQIIDKAIKMHLQCNRGDGIGKLLTTKSFTLQQLDKLGNESSHQEECKEYYKQALHLHILMKDTVRQKTLNDYYKGEFGKVMH